MTSVFNLFYNFWTIFLIYHMNSITEVKAEDQNDDGVVFSNKLVPTTITQKKCNTYISQACNGKLKRSTTITTISNEMFVVGGQNARAQEFPHMALIGYGEFSKVKWYCGGTLISENFILCAAHCALTAYGDAKWIRLGELNYASTTDDAKTMDFEILQRIVHPDYIPPVYNDIALFKFQGIKEFNDYIRPICLNILHNLKPETLVALGWGSTGYGEAFSPILQKVNLSIINNSVCDEVLAGRELSNGFNESTMICAGELSGGKDTCQGDSGGPIQYKLPYSGCYVSTYSQFGIVSFGKGCGWANTSAIYTKVSFYVPWIEKIVWSTD